MKRLLHPTTTLRPLALAWALVFVACSSPPGSEAPSAEAHAGDTGPEARPSAPPVPVPADVSSALLPSVPTLASTPGSPEHERFDVSVKNAPAREFFISLVEGTRYNVALDPGVKGAITLSLKGVTIREVLETVADAYGYGYRETPTGFLILPAGIRTRIFQMNYLNLQRQGYSKTRSKIGTLTDTDTSGDNRTVNDPTSSDGPEEGSGSGIETLSTTDLWQEITQSVRTILAGREGRSVVASPNAGLLIVRATSQELEQVADYLESAEKSMGRLVILEAKILEIRLDTGFQSGVNWAALATHDNAKGVVGQVGGGSVLDKGLSEISGRNVELGPKLSDLAVGTGTSAFGGVFTAAIQADKFSMFVELLESQGDVRTLSNPRIATVNNQKAVIRVGNDEFFVTDVSTTTVTGTATTSTPSITLTPFFSGIVLDVTPQISDEDDVILHIHPSVTLVEEQNKVIALDPDAPLELPLAFSRVREADSIVRARSGQIVVIGGLMQNTTTDEDAGVPWIKDIPYLGKLFQHVRFQSRKTELVILLRPLVVGPDGWDGPMADVAERVSGIKERSIEQKAEKNREKRKTRPAGLGDWLTP